MGRDGDSGMKTGPRYIVTEPVPEGFAWYCVADTQHPTYPNFTVVQIFRDAPDAKRLIELAADELNGQKDYAVKRAKIRFAYQMACLVSCLVVGFAGQYHHDWFGVAQFSLYAVVFAIMMLTA